MLLALGTALWLGILTSISPCPLATNIAAISFISKRVDLPRAVLAAGLIYTLGRMLAYLVVAVIAVVGILSIPGLANFLQEYMNKALGPLLIIIGVVLLEVIPLRFSFGGSTRLQEAAERRGLWGAGLLGVVFALSFCPVSAALFFGSLIPLAVGAGSTIALPLIYGLGTALPVVLFAALLAFATQAVGKAYNRLKAFEYWARRVTGGVFIVIGLYYTITCTFGFGSQGGMQ